MPTRAPRRCTAPGCANLTPTGRCAAHRKRTQDTINQARGSSHQQGYGATHRARRAQVLREEHACRHCGSPHHPHVDHINGDKTDNRRENLQRLCAPCHSHKTATQDGRWG